MQDIEPPVPPAGAGGTASAAAPAGAPRPARLGLLLLCLLAAGLRLFPVRHGLPDNHVPDTHAVNAALGMAQDRDPVPPVGRYSTYPNLLPYLLVPVYAGQYVLGRVEGDWHGAQEYGMRLKEQPWRAHLPARVLVALLAALAPWWTVRGLRAAGLGVGAWAGGYLMATSLLQVHLSTQERPWALVGASLALCAWPAAEHVRGGRRRPLLLSGLAAAVAFGLHQGGLAYVLIPALAWLVGPLGFTGTDLRRRLGWGLACAAVFVLFTLAVGHPYLVVHGRTAVSDVAAGEHLAGTTHLTFGGQAFVLAFHPGTFLELGRTLLGYDPLLVLLGLLGVVGGLRRRALVPVTGFALVWGAIFLTGQNPHVRYLVPLTAALCWPAAVAVEGLARRGAGRPLLLILGLLPLVQAVRLGVVLREEDTRAQARDELLRRAAEDPTMRVAVDVGGPELPLDLPSLRRLAELRPWTGREEHRAMLLEAGVPHPDGAGLDAVPLNALFEFQPRHRGSWPAPATREAYGQLAEDPNAVLRALGVTHVLLVDRTPGDGFPGLLLDRRPALQDEDVDLDLFPGRVRPHLAPLEVADEVLWSSGPGPAATRAQLPLEMGFALTDLWRAGRPGPALELRALSR